MSILTIFTSNHYPVFYLYDKNGYYPMSSPGQNGLCDLSLSCQSENQCIEVEYDQRQKENHDEDFLEFIQPVMSRVHVIGGSAFFLGTGTGNCKKTDSRTEENT